MSRVGRKPVPVPAGITVEAGNGQLKVKGPKGELVRELPDTVRVDLDGQQAVVAPTASHKQAKIMHGTIRSHLANMIEGVKDGYAKHLDIQGVGFRAVMKGPEVVLSLGYSHEIRYTPPEGVTITVTDNTQVAITGIDKQKVGQAAAQIRSYAPAEPYKGKGVRYKDEKIRRKVGKAVS